MNAIFAWVRWRSTKARRAEADRLIDETPLEDVAPVAQYLRAMCGWSGAESADFAWAAVLWLHTGELVLPRRSRALRLVDQVNLPLPYERRRTLA